MTIKRKWVVAIALGVVTAACTPNDTGMGSAAKHNYAAQIVEPDPKYEDPLAANGDQTAGAQERYREGKVKKPVGVKTTSGSGGSSGGN